MVNHRRGHDHGGSWRVIRPVNTAIGKSTMLSSSLTSLSDSNWKGGMDDMVLHRRVKWTGPSPVQRRDVTIQKGLRCKQQWRPMSKNMFSNLIQTRIFWQISMSFLYSWHKHWSYRTMWNSLSLQKKPWLPIDKTPSGNKWSPLGFLCKLKGKLRYF